MERYVRMVKRSGGLNVTPILPRATAHAESAQAPHPHAAAAWPQSRAAAGECRSRSGASGWAFGAILLYQLCKRAPGAQEPPAPEDQR